MLNRLNRGLLTLSSHILTIMAFNESYIDNTFSKHENPVKNVLQNIKIGFISRDLKGQDNG